MNNLFLDIWKIIFNFLDFKSKIRLISTCRYSRQNLYITDLYNINKKYLYKLNTPILQYYIFRNVIWLNASFNNNITNISFMKNLKKLNLHGYNNINQDGIMGLDLIELYVDNHDKIKDVSFMKNLKILHASGNCGIDQNGIIGLDLIELDISYNYKIKDISFMKNLKKLNIRGKCEIYQDNIKNLDLIELDISYNNKIKDVSTYRNKTMFCSHILLWEMLLCNIS